MVVGDLSSAIERKSERANSAAVLQTIDKIPLEHDLAIVFSKVSAYKHGRECRSHHRTTVHSDSHQSAI